ncbi:hypothetical protein [Pelagibius marinus]|uniref:hypothetical protein n=1 Tax=Pelagibius marinus TaxID=2762760 RepID=UPI001872A6E2|nr:hypothetical protein [Pelagibius marinus]
MSFYESRFRPWLDDPAGWPDWLLTPEEAAGFAADQAAAGAEAAARLTNLYGEQADTFGAAGLVEALAAQSLDAADLQAVALAIAAADYHRERLPVPRAEVGGITNPRNRPVWEKLRPYLVARCRAALAAQGAEALQWRAILGRVPDNWLPAAQLTRALQQELNASGLFSEVEVTLELNPPVAGGGRWIAMQCRGTLAELRRRLPAREPCLVELIRDAEDAAPQWAVAYRLEDELSLGRDGVERVRLWFHDPRRGGAEVSLRITLADDRIQAVETPAPEAGAAVKALRLVKLEPGEPPRFGWRRWFRRAHPWGAFWWLKRLWLLRFSRAPG